MKAQRDNHAWSSLKSFPTSNYTWHNGLYPHNYASLLLEAVLPPSEEPRNLLSKNDSTIHYPILKEKKIKF